MSMSIAIVRKRVRGLVWFGVLSYRRMHITYEKRKSLCPCCQHELEPMRYFGAIVFQKNSCKSDYIANFWSPLKENGEVVWFSAPDLEKCRYDW
jgi:hypothetical protein